MRRGCNELALLFATGLALPADAETREWSSATASTMARGRWEAGIVHGLRWGASNDVELSTNPLLFLVLPQTAAKVRWMARGAWSLATRHRLSCPTWFLQLVSREGAGGLLPAHTDVPIALQLDSDALASLQVARDHRATAALGFSVAPRFTSGSGLPLLDFPFLYRSFAALKTFATGHVGLAMEGTVWRALAYSVDLDGFVLPVIPGGFAIEQDTSLRWRPSRSFEVLLGCRLSYARYPIGNRFHYLPYGDIVVGF